MPSGLIFTHLNSVKLWKIFPIGMYYRKALDMAMSELLFKVYIFTQAAMTIFTRMSCLNREDPCEFYLQSQKYVEEMVPLANVEGYVGPYVFKMKSDSKMCHWTTSFQYASGSQHNRWKFLEKYTPRCR